MHLYNISVNAAQNDVGNGITLRADLRLLLDATGFVLVPANDGFVVQFLDPHSGYEDRRRAPVALHDRVRNQFLYARFAYNIIQISRRSSSIRTLKSVPLPPWAVSAAPPTLHEPYAPEADEHEQGGSRGYGSEPWLMLSRRTVW